MTPRPSLPERDVQPKQDGAKIGHELRQRGGAAPRHDVPEMRERAVEVLDRLPQVPGVVERHRDALLEQHPLLRVSRITVDQEIQPRRLPEMVEGFARRRRAGRLVARLEEILLGLLQLRRLTVVVGEHAEEVGQPIGEQTLDRLRHAAMELLAGPLEDRLIHRLLDQRVLEDVLELLREGLTPDGGRPPAPPLEEDLSLLQVSDVDVEADIRSDDVGEHAMVDAAPDHRSGLQEAARVVREPVDARHDDFLHRPRRRPSLSANH